MKNRNAYLMIGIFLLLMLGIFLSTINIASAVGFGSTYLPSVNGVATFEIPIGSNKSYFIFPQNFDNQTILLKINVTDTNNIMQNKLQNVYEIPPNTESDDFKIELIMGLQNRTELIGQKFSISYTILSTYKTNETLGVVTFNPIGYTKSFVVAGINPLPPVPVCNSLYYYDDNNRNCNQKQFCDNYSYSGLHTFNNQQDCLNAVNPPTPTPSTSSQNQNTQPSIQTPNNNTQPNLIIPIQTPTPIKTEQPVENSVVPTGKFSYLWIIIIGAVLIVGVITIAIKKHNNPDSSNSSYNNNDVIDEEI